MKNKIILVLITTIIIVSGCTTEQKSYSCEEDPHCWTREEVKALELLYGYNCSEDAMVYVKEANTSNWIGTLFQWQTNMIFGARIHGRPIHELEFEAECLTEDEYCPPEECSRMDIS